MSRKRKAAKKEKDSQLANPTSYVLERLKALGLEGCNSRDIMRYILERNVRNTSDARCVQLLEALYKGEEIILSIQQCDALEEKGGSQWYTIAEVRALLEIIKQEKTHDN